MTFCCGDGAGELVGDSSLFFGGPVQYPGARTFAYEAPDEEDDWPTGPISSVLIPGICDPLPRGPYNSDDEENEDSNARVFEIPLKESRRGILKTPLGTDALWHEWVASSKEFSDYVDEDEVGLVHFVNKNKRWTEEQLQKYKPYLFEGILENPNRPYGISNNIYVQRMGFIKQTYSSYRKKPRRSEEFDSCDPDDDFRIIKEFKSSPLIRRKTSFSEVDDDISDDIRRIVFEPKPLFPKLSDTYDDTTPVRLSSGSEGSHYDHDDSNVVNIAESDTEGDYSHIADIADFSQEHVSSVKEEEFDSGQSEGMQSFEEHGGKIDQGTSLAKHVKIEQEPSVGDELDAGQTDFVATEAHDVRIKEEDDKTELFQPDLVKAPLKVPKGDDKETSSFMESDISKKRGTERSHKSKKDDGKRHKRRDENKKEPKEKRDHRDHHSNRNKLEEGKVEKTTSTIQGGGKHRIARVTEDGRKKLLETATKEKPTEKPPPAKPKSSSVKRSKPAAPKESTSAERGVDEKTHSILDLLPKETAPVHIPVVHRKKETKPVTAIKTERPAMKKTVPPKPDDVLASLNIVESIKSKLPDLKIPLKKSVMRTSVVRKQKQVRSPQQKASIPATPNPINPPVVNEDASMGNYETVESDHFANIILPFSDNPEDILTNESGELYLLQDDFIEEALGEHLDDKVTVPVPEPSKFPSKREILARKRVKITSSCTVPAYLQPVVNVERMVLIPGMFRYTTAMLQLLAKTLRKRKQAVTGVKKAEMKAPSVRSETSAVGGLKEDVIETALPVGIVTRVSVAETGTVDTSENVAPVLVIPGFESASKQFATKQMDEFDKKFFL